VKEKRFFTWRMVGVEKPERDGSPVLFDKMSSGERQYPRWFQPTVVENVAVKAP